MGRVKELSYVEVGDDVAVRLHHTCPPNLLAFGRVAEVEDYGFGGIVEVLTAGHQRIGEDCEIDLLETARIRGWIDDPNGGVMPNPDRKINTIPRTCLKPVRVNPDSNIPF